MAETSTSGAGGRSRRPSPVAPDGPATNAATVDDEYVYAPPTTRKAKDGYGTRQELLRFARAFRYAVEVEFIDGSVPPLWLRNGYDNAREITGLDHECWPAPWERES